MTDAENPEAARTHDRLPRLVVVVLVFCAFLGADRVFQRGREVAGIDFYQFWAVGLVAREIPDLDPYAEASRGAIPRWVATRAAPSPRLALAQGRRPTLETYSSPFLYAVFGAFATGRYDFDHVLFEACSMAALVLGLAGIGRRASLSWAVLLGAMVFVLEWTEPTFSDASVGNVSRLQIAAIALLMFLADAPARDRSNLSGGVLLGLALAFKPTFVFVAILLFSSRLLRRRWRALGLGVLGVVLGLAGAVLLSGVFFPPAAWTTWVRTVESLPPEIVTLALGNYSLIRLCLGDAASAASWLVATALLAAVVFVLVKHGGHPGEERLVLGLGCLILILSSPLVWTHYFVLALPLAILCLPGPAGHSGPVRALALAGLATQATRPLLSLLSAEGFWQEAALLNVGAILIFAAGVLELRSRR
jgi:hypothetical protein